MWTWESCAEETMWTWLPDKKVAMLALIEERISERMWDWQGSDPVDSIPEDKKATLSTLQVASLTGYHASIENVKRGTLTAGGGPAAQPEAERHWSSANRGHSDYLWDWSPGGWNDAMCYAVYQ